MSGPIIIKILGGRVRHSCEAVIEIPGRLPRRFDWNPIGLYEKSFHDIGTMAPADAGFTRAAPIDVRSALGGGATIEIELPGDELAALNWEGLSPGGVIRRCPTQAPGLLGLQFPLRMAVMWMPGSELAATIAKSLSEALNFELQTGQVKIDLFPVVNPEQITSVLERQHYDVIHLSAPTSLRGRHCSTRFGDLLVDTRQVLNRTLAARPRMVFYHGLSSDASECMSGLRMASQATENFGTGCVMYAAAAADLGATEFVVKTYLDAFSRDEDLTLRTSRHRRKPGASLLTSVVAPPERTSLLELRPAIQTERDRAAAMLLDLDTIGEESSGARHFTLTRAQHVAQLVPKLSLTSELFDLTESNKEIKDAVRGAEQNLRSETGKPDRERFPVGNFCHCAESPDDWVAIGENRTLTKPPVGRRLEFHFWIDPIKRGIKTLAGDIFGPREGTVYPIRLQARVWSEKPSLQFGNEESPLIVPETGMSNRARFVLSVYPDHGDTEFFLFLLHQQEASQASSKNATLVGAFRIFARFREQSVIDEDAQSVVQIFSSSDYFRFREKPGTSAMTILFDKADDGSLRVFTLEAEGRPWAKLGVQESSLNDIDRDMYRLLTKVALDAATGERLGQEGGPSSQSLQSLAEYGYTQLQNLFTVEADKGAKAFSHRLKDLDAGSQVTVATTDKTRNMILPWGLLYLDSDFREFPYPVRLDSFLGYKYNLVVRPSMALGPSSGENHKPVRMAAAWLSRPETKVLENKLALAKQNNQLSYDRMKAKNSTLPGLDEKEFDLIHFYCHGHTRFPNEFHPQDFIKLFENHVQSVAIPAAPTTELAQFLDRVQDAPDSLMFLDGGFVYRATLGETTGDLQGAPIVLLSMCESAQVTVSGAGFVTFFLSRGARAVMGTEGPTLWSLGRDIDLRIIEGLLNGETIGQAFFAAKREAANKNALALIYSLWGDRDARVVAPPEPSNTR